MGAQTGLEINLSLLCRCFPVLCGNCWLKVGFLSSSYSASSYCPRAGSSIGRDGVVGSRYGSVLRECQQGAGSEAGSVAVGGWRKSRAHGRADGPTSCPTISGGLVQKRSLYSGVHVE